MDIPRSATAALFVSVLVGCMGYVPGRQSYWDNRIKELCDKDGGVMIYGRVRVSKADVDRGVLPAAWSGPGIGNGERWLGATLKELAHPDAPVYAERKETILRDWNPQVGRIEWVYIRRSDQAVVARTVSYGRSGGDFPSPAHASTFSCPEARAISSALNQLFIVDEAK